MKDPSQPDHAESPAPPPAGGAAVSPAAAAGVPVAQAITAVRWTLLGNLLQRGITFGAVALVARLLTETEYGAYRQILSTHLVFFVLLPLGFDQLYIREVNLRDRFALLLTGALTVAGALTAIVMVAGHWLAVRWMDFGPWSGMLWLFPVVVMVQAWKLYYKTDLAARMDYRRISIAETLYAITSAAGGVALALVWPGAWALYVAYLAAEVAEVLWLYRGGRALPPLGESLQVFRREAHRWKRFGLFHCGTQVLNAVGGHAPVIIFGSMLSKASAAAFSMANYLVTVPIYLLIGALHRVAYSALAGRNRADLTSAVLRMLSLAAAFIVPVLIWVALLADPLVRVVLGQSWVESTAPVVMMVASYCIFVALFSPISSIDLLLDRPDYGFVWTAAAAVVRVVAVVAGLRYGVMEAVATYAAVSVVLWITWGIMLAHLLGCGQKRFHRAWIKLSPLWLVLAVLLGAMLRALAAAGFPVTAYPWAALVLSGVPALLYVALIAVAMPDVLRQGLRLLRRG